MKKKEKEQPDIEELVEMAKEIQQKTKELNDLVIAAEATCILIEFQINKYDIYGAGYRVIPLSVKTRINIK
jgi:uncharacterized Zn finger protein